MKILKQVFGSIRRSQKSVGRESSQTRAGNGGRPTVSDRIGRNTCFALIGGIMLSFFTSASASTLMFTIDPAQSSVTGSGTFGGAAITEQGPGSLTTSFSGTMDVTLDDDLNPTTLSIDAMSLDALVNGMWGPLPGGGTGVADADMAAQAASALFTGNVALRELIVSGVMSPAVPVVSGAFDSMSLGFTVTSGNLDYNGTAFGFPVMGSTSIAPHNTNNIADPSSITYSNSTAILTIPINFTVLKNVSGLELIFNCTGALVATAQAGGDTNAPAVLCSLAPTDVTNLVGEVHTVTANVTSNGAPVSGVTVDFEVLSGPNVGGTGSDTTAANGDAGFAYTGGGGVGTDIIQATGMVDGQSFTCTATKVWVEAIIGCSLTPSDATNVVNTIHSVTANVTSDGVPAPGVTVDFEVLSGPNVGGTGSDTTAANGDAGFAYTGGGGVGTDIIQATGMVGGQSFTCTATKVWVDAMIGCSLSPSDATNVVNTIHSVTANVTSEGVPAPGVTVDFEVISGPNVGSTGSNPTDANGDAGFAYTGASGVGTDIIQATGIIDGHSFTCTATKVWLDIMVGCSLSPSDATNLVGTLHSVTANVTVNGTPAPGVTVDFAILSGPNTAIAGADITDANGDAGFDYSGDGGAGTDIIQAIGSVAGHSFTCTATKVWLPLTPTCTLTPPVATNQVGSAHGVGVIVAVNSIPAPGVSVGFAVVSGPNAGASGLEVTDVNGQAAFTYSSNGSAGTDTIEASGSVGGVDFSCSATKVWVTGPCPNLNGLWSSVKNKCKPKSGVTECKLGGKLTVTNNGTVDAAETIARFFLSDDNVLDGGDTQIAESIVKALQAGKSTKAKLKATLSGVDTVGKFVIAVLDAGNAVTECDEGDNTAATGPLP